MFRHNSAPPIDLAQKSLRQLHDSVESSIDPLGMAAPLVHAQLAWMAHPQELADALSKVSTSLWALQWHSMRRLMGCQARIHSSQMRTTVGLPILCGPIRRHGIW